MSSRTQSPREELALKQKLLEAALVRAPGNGFSDETLARAGEDVGLDKQTVARLFPGGAASLIEFFSMWADGEMERRLREKQLSALPVRERIAEAIRTRLAVLRPHKEAARRAAAVLSLPVHAALGMKLVYRTVDAMWRAVGDTSTDFNFYTKRGILSGVYSASLVRWFTDPSPDEAETEAFIAHRIDDVMRLEKFKTQVKETLKGMPSLTDVLSRFNTKRP